MGRSRKHKRNGSPQRKSSAQKNDPVKGAADAAGQPRRLAWSRPQQIGVCVLLVWLHLSSVQAVYEAWRHDGIATVVLALPAVAIWATVAGSRSGWWRWLVLGWIVVVATPPYGFVTFAVGEVWLIDRSWILEAANPRPRPPRRRGLREVVMSRFGRAAA